MGGRVSGRSTLSLFHSNLQHAHPLLNFSTSTLLKQDAHPLHNSHRSPVARALLLTSHPKPFLARRARERDHAPPSARIESDICAHRL